MDDGDEHDVTDESCTNFRPLESVGSSDEGVFSRGICTVAQVDMEESRPIVLDKEQDVTAEDEDNDDEEAGNDSEGDATPRRRGGAGVGKKRAASPASTPKGGGKRGRG